MGCASAGGASMKTIGTATIVSTRAVNHGLPTAPRKARKDAVKMTEKQFMATVIELAKMRGWKVYHTHDSRRCEAGFPDLLMARGVRLIAAELKLATKQPTEAQTNWLQAFADAGVFAVVWRPEDWSQIE